MAQKLLLADDSITIQKVVELVLAEEDFQIKSVGNGEDALNAVNTFMPDIVLADIEMPKMNGYQLCEKIKANPATAGIPVILLAGAFEPMDEDLARKVGADDSVVKPFESQELISKINAALTMVSTEEEAIAVAEEEGEAVEAIEATSEISADEDLWALEEPAEAPTVEAWAEEPLPMGEALEEEAFAIAEEETAPIEDATIIMKPQVTAPPAAAPVSEAAIREAVSLSQDELRRIYDKAIRESVSNFVASFDMKGALFSTLTPAIKDAVEKILWEIAPDLVDKMLKEILKGSIASLTKEVEKVIWETVPDLASNMISQEIEKIKSEL